MELNQIEVCMEKYLRKYILAEVRRIPELKKELIKLKEIQGYILNSTKSSGTTGQPKAKYSFGDVTSEKALEQVLINNRIKHIERELAVFEGTRKELSGIQKKIFEETIISFGVLEAKAQLLGMSEKTLAKERGKILTKMAVELDLYINIDNLAKKY